MVYFAFLTISKFCLTSTTLWQAAEFYTVAQLNEEQKQDTSEAVKVYNKIIYSLALSLQVWLALQ